MISWIRNRFHPLWRLRRTAWFRALQKRIDFPVSIRKGRIRQYVMLLRDFSLVIPHRGAEVKTGVVFLKVLQVLQPGLFLDVGANVGSYAWTAADFDSTLTVWLFEPDEQNIRLLKKTIAVNQLSQARLFPMAVASKNGQAEFLLDDVSGATGSLDNQSSNASSLHSQYELQKTKTVECYCLDSFYEEMQGRCVFIKIDVEGAEDQALAGARRVLEFVRPVILIECFESVKMALLQEMGYRIYNLEEGCNWLAIPQERVEPLAREIPELQSLSLI